jgi:hypothetical protein
MAFRGALVDRCYKQAKVGDTRIVQGQRIYRPLEQAVIRCRLEPPGGAESTSGGQTTADRRTSLLLDRKDADHNLVDLNASEKLRIVSRELGDGVWQVDGEPKALRKKRRIIGWEANVRQLDEDPNPRTG